MKRKRIFWLIIVLIFILAVFFRTYNYTDRVFVHADNARDIQVARYAADNFKVPQVGQFSSAGPFFYGPWYYWFLEAVSFIPFGFLTHWYVMTILYLLFIVLMFWLGNKIGDKWTGSLAALFAAISTSQINFSLAVWNVSIVPILSAVALVVLVKFIQSQKLIYLWLLGFTVTLSVTIHLQSLLILPILLVALFWGKLSAKIILKNLLILILGSTVALAPLIYFDARHNWHNLQSLFIFLTVDQFNIFTPNRWLLYIGRYWPETWSYIIGGSKYLGWVIIIILSLLVVLKVKYFRFHKAFFAVLIAFALGVVLFRYYRGERHLYYTLFSHSFVILLTAWATSKIFRIKNYLGLVLVTLIIIMTINQSFKDLKARGVTLSEINSIAEKVYSQYPNEKFAIYGCHVDTSMAHPLALLIYYEGRADSNATKVGICEREGILTWTFLEEADLVDPIYGTVWWYNKSTDLVYKDTVEWWLTKPPVKGEGNFWQFIRQNSPIPIFRILPVS